MKTISIKAGISASEFDAAATVWLNESDCELVLPNSLTETEIRHLHELAIGKIPNEFAYCVLESMAEFTNTPHDVLRSILSTGERSCIESVCMRSDIPNDLQETCDQVAEHGKQK